MKNKIILSILAICALSITGCATQESPALQEEMMAPTGYWYLRDDGKQVWRTLTPDNTQTPQKIVPKNYPKSFGNGRG